MWTLKTEAKIVLARRKKRENRHNKNIIKSKTCFHSSAPVSPKDKTIQPGFCSILKRIILADTKEESFRKTTTEGFPRGSKQNDGEFQTYLYPQITWSYTNISLPSLERHFSIVIPKQKHTGILTIRTPQGLSQINPVKGIRSPCKTHLDEVLYSEL